MTTILAATLSRVPEAVLRSKSAASSELLCCLAEEHAEQVCSEQTRLSILLPYLQIHLPVAMCKRLSSDDPTEGFVVVCRLPP